MKWTYPEKEITREEAENAVLLLGFTPNNEGIRGWVKKVPVGVLSKKCKSRRFHIIPATEGFEIHIDSKNHKVKKAGKVDKVLKDLVEELESFFKE